MTENEILALQRQDDKMYELVDTVRGKFTTKKVEIPWRDFGNQPRSSLKDAPLFAYWNGKGTAVLPKELYSEQEFNKFVNLLKAQIQKDCPGDYAVSVNPNWRKSCPSWYPANSYGVDVINLNWLKFAVSIETNKKRRKWEQAISW